MLFRLGIIAVIGILRLPLLADGFNACTLPQKDIATKAGVERPISRAYDAVCVAVLPPTCRDYTAGGKPCAYRACLVVDTLKSCPNGDPLMFTAATIEPYTVKSVKPLSPGELAAMNRAIDAEAKRMAAKWTDNGRVPLSPAAMTVLRNMSCQMVAFGNPTFGVCQGRS